MAALRSTQWGQCVCGPPGSGKSTYCHAMYQVLNAAGRPTIIVNLDPANDSVPYPCAINITDLIRVSDAADAFALGPNGGAMYCLEYLAENTDWLLERLEQHSGAYILLDCPGQAELFTHHEGFFRVFEVLTKRDYRLTAVHLVDSAACTDAAKFLSIAMLSLLTMVRLSLPHVNLLSKLDALPSLGRLAAPLDTFTDDLHMGRVLDALRDPWRTEPDRVDDDDAASVEEASGAGPGRGFTRYRALNERLAELCDDYNLLAFVPVSIKDPETLSAAIRIIDKSNGFVPLHRHTHTHTHARADTHAVADVDSLMMQERYTERFGRPP